MLSCWGITDGSAGMVAQVRALASVLGLQPEMKKIQLRPVFAVLPNLIFASPLRSLILPVMIDASHSDSLAAPLPDLVISCGRRAALVAMGLRARMQGVQNAKTRFIHIQDPQVSAKQFDLVIAMQHDKITGPNVIKTRFALHTITQDSLNDAAQVFAPRFAGYATPRVAVLLGGSTNKYQLGIQAMAQVIASLRAVLGSIEGSLLITPSRRTGEGNIAMLNAAFAGNPRVYIYDFISENPYMAMLALADAIIVTNDSVNMMSEACATGKPVYILPLPGHDHTKPSRFAEALVRDGMARIPDGKLERWNYAFDNEMGKLGKEVTQVLGIS